MPEEAQMSDLLGKDFKTTELKVLKELKVHMDKDTKTLYEHNENTNKETEVIIRNQDNSLKQKSKIVEVYTEALKAHFNKQKKGSANLNWTIEIIEE